MKELIEYLESNLIDFVQKSKNVVEIDNQTYQLVEPDEEGFLFDESLEMMCEDTIEDNYVFKFGGIWYHTPKGTETQPKFNRLKHIGKANTSLEPIPWLGVRGKYEILNGSRGYEDWCEKAKFLGVNTLGICEKNTLAGTLQFQEICKDNNIKSIIGATYTVFNQKKDTRYDVKVYAKNYEGWQVILSINKDVLVDNEGFISEEQLKLLKTDDIYLIADPKSLWFEDVNLEFNFFQYDSVKYRTKQADIDYLNNLKKYMLSEIEPVLIQDSFYLDKEDNHIKKKLNTISGVRELTSDNQYFKSFDDIFDEFDELFDPSDDSFELYLENAKKNLIEVANNCNFEIETGGKFLPKYKMTLEEKRKYQTNEKMFDVLVDEGLKAKVKKEDYTKYKNRCEEEKETIDYGELRDYFLINWEQIDWCNKQGIYTGLSRGSAAGSVLSYSLGITKIDPIKYGLIFSRFLTKERAKNSVADIDIDHCQIRRDEVKKHHIEKYGYNQCCSVGTHGTLQLKAAIKDLSRVYGLNFGTVNIICSIIPKEVKTWLDFIYLGSRDLRIKSFIKENPELINDLSIVFNGIKSESVHASAFIITPEEKTVFEWLPVRLQDKDGEKILVSEWSGEELEKAGFLKQDILGLLQLTKFDYTNQSIVKNGGKAIDIYSLPLDDKKTYNAISKGYTQDVFQFGSKGLAEYIKEVKPKEINDLIVGVALYRPGAMESGFHTKWVKIRNGEEKPEFIKGWEEITKETDGLLVYQEQVMFICQQIAGFDLEETDSIRKALGKKKPEILEKYKQRFIDGGVRNGFTEVELIDQWDYIERTSGYLFNKSHAAAYAITGYFSAYLKINYPIHSRYTSLTLLKPSEIDTKLPNYISEIIKMGDVKFSSVEINKSTLGFSVDFDNNSIYWSLNSVKQCGDKAVEQLVKDKEEKGDYFDFKEFLQRNVYKGSKVTKQVIEHLVLSGAFDEIENIHQSKDRLRLIEYYREECKIKVDELKDIFAVNEDSLDFNYWWNMQQKRLSGFALFDYKVLCDNLLECNNRYENDLQSSNGDIIKTGGYINEIVVRTSKKGEYADVILDNNFEFIPIKFWYEQWDKVKDLIRDKEKCILLISGKVNFDRYKGAYTVVANDNSDILVLE